MPDTPKPHGWSRDEIAEAIASAPPPSFHEVLNALLHTTVQGLAHNPEPSVQKDLLNALYKVLYFGIGIDAVRRMERSAAKLPKMDATKVCKITESVLDERFNAATKRLELMLELFKEPNT